MRKTIHMALMTVAFATLTASTAFALSCDYSNATTTTITALPQFSEVVSVNAGDDLIFRQFYGNQNIANLYLFDGVNTTLLSSTGSRATTGSGVINDNGQVAYIGFDGTDFETYLYDGISTIQISNSDNNVNFVGMNNNGKIVWSEKTSTNAHDIYLFDGVTTTLIAQTPCCVLPQPKINNNDVVLYVALDGSDLEAFLYDGVANINFSDTRDHVFDADLNDSGSVVWRNSNQSLVLKEAGDKKGRVIARGVSHSRIPLISNSGAVTWAEHDGEDWEIYLYENRNTTQLTDNLTDDYEPRINSAGFVVWISGNDGVGGDYNDIFVNDGVQSFQLTDNLYNNSDAKIGDSGVVVYTGWDNGQLRKVTTNCTP